MGPRIELRGPAALVVLVAIATGVWWSFAHTENRLERRRQATFEFLQVETPGLAEQLAVQQQRVRARTGSFTTDVDELMAAWDAQLGDSSSVAPLAERHRIEVAVDAGGFAIAVFVRDDGGPVYRVAVDERAGRVVRVCDDLGGACSGGTWPPAIDDGYLLSR